MPEAKRSRPSEDLSPSSRQVRPRRADDSRSVAESAAPPTSSRAEKKVPAGPANPGVVRKRDEGVLSRLPPDSDVLDVFANLRRDGDLTDEEAFLKLFTTYDVSLSTLNQISSNVYPTLLHRQLICMASLVILLTSSTTYSSKVALIV
jgi:hypothetical protein